MSLNERLHSPLDRRLTGLNTVIHPRLYENRP